MAPRGRKKKTGLMREDAAKDAMGDYGFDERVIRKSIKQLLGMYEDENPWRFIEEGSYAGLLEVCLENQREYEQVVADNEGQQAETAPQVEEQEEEANLEQEQQHVEEGGDNVGSNSASLVGNGTEACQTDENSMTGEPAVMDSSSPAPVVTNEASDGYAQQSARGSRNSHCGWISDEEESDPEETGDAADDDDEMVQLTPEPLCEELEELLREVRGQKRRKKASRWDN